MTRHCDGPRRLSSAGRRTQWRTLGDAVAAIAMQTARLEGAVAQIPNGASLMIRGFMGVGTPERLVGEVVRQGRRIYP